MIISATTDYPAACERKLPPFLFHYIDGGAYAEHTLRPTKKRSQGAVFCWSIYPYGAVGMDLPGR